MERYSGARAASLLSLLWFYEFSIKEPPERPLGVRRSLLPLSGGLDVLRVAHVFLRLDCFGSAAWPS